jgi:4'-phosphopantetheinyl transferase
MTATLVTEVTLLAVDLDRDALDGDWALLSADEVARALRFRFDVHRRRYVVGRAEVRRALATEVGQDPAEVVFEYGEYGRPDLAGHPELSFNFSNCEGTGLLAISTRGRVGVDHECVRPQFADGAVAERYFAPGEVRRLGALAAESRHAAFFRCWTRKEALLKANGAGLSLPLQSFEVTLEPDQPARLVVGGPVLGAGEWELSDVSAAVPGHIAAIAVQRDGSRSSVSQRGE